MMYSSAYVGVTRYSDLNALIHSLSVTREPQLARKWTLFLTGAAQDSTLGRVPVPAFRAERAYAIAGHL